MNISRKTNAIDPQKSIVIEVQCGTFWIRMRVDKEISISEFKRLLQINLFRISNQFRSAHYFQMSPVSAISKISLPRVVSMHIKAEDEAKSTSPFNLLEEKNVIPIQMRDMLLSVVTPNLLPRDSGLVALSASGSLVGESKRIMLEECLGRVMAFVQRDDESHVFRDNVLQDLEILSKRKIPTISLLPAEEQFTWPPYLPTSLLVRLKLDGLTKTVKAKPNESIFDVISKGTARTSKILKEGVKGKEYVLKKTGTKQYIHFNISEKMQLQHFPYVVECARKSIPISFTLVTLTPQLKSHLDLALSFQQPQQMIMNASSSSSSSPLEEEGTTIDWSKIFSTEKSQSQHSHQPQLQIQSMSEVKQPFQCAVTGLGNIHIISRNITNAEIFVCVRLYHGSEQIGNEMKTTTKSLNQAVRGSFQWTEILSSNVNYCDLPTSAMTAVMCVVLLRSSPFSSSKEKVVAAVSWRLCDHHGKCDNTAFRLKCWTLDSDFITMKVFWQLYENSFTFLAANETSSSSSSSSLESEKVGASYVKEVEPEFKCKENNVTPLDILLRRCIPNFENEQVGLTVDIQPSLKSYIWNPRPLQRKKATILKLLSVPSESEKRKLLQVVLRENVIQLNAEEKELIWQYQEFLRQYPFALFKVVSSQSYARAFTQVQIARIISEWPDLTPDNAISLLLFHIVDPLVREFAVSQLDSMNDNQLILYLFPLVQVLKDEPFHWNALSKFLLKRAIKNPLEVGTPLCWMLYSELSDPSISERYWLLLEAYFASCPQQLELFASQRNLINQLLSMNALIRQTDPAERASKLKELCAAVSIVSPISLPTHPHSEIDSLIFEECSIFDSFAAPMKLCFKNIEPQADPVVVILKVGDDLRQDLLCLNLFSLMDSVCWKAYPEEMMTLYSVVNVGPKAGLIEAVPKCTTIADIERNAGGVLAVLKKTPVANWLKSNAMAEYDLVTRNFMYSTAAACVATYVLGIGDRHNDNIMVTKDGHLFHIDFAHFLGQFMSFHGFKREKAPFVLTSEFVFVFEKQYDQFVKLCGKLFNDTRRQASLFINYFGLMMSSGIEGLHCLKDITYVRLAFAPSLSESGASELFKQLIEESINTKTTQLNFAVHLFAHPKTS